MKYFVLVYDQAAGKLVSEDEFPEERLQAALERRFKLERDLRRRSAIEVVLLAASDLGALKLTHARYFKSAEELATAS